MSSAAVSPAIIAAVLRRPRLWATAVRQARRLAPPGWWRRRPFLPLPDAEYLRFRSLTQYGDGEHRLQADDAIAYLEWCRNQRHETVRPSNAQVH